ncbi:DUF3153 domain-containing protein [Paenibacillus jiagnxiensis]|uniref:DUF3153 domain-containing protein n=1 Tax=Paenibacillus jiagnxiensis TaxID=3228926 RepID=UPI0033A9C776
MSLYISRCGRLIVAAALLLLLCSCAKGDAQATVHIDRSIDLDVEVSVSENALSSLYLQNALEDYKQPLEQYGIQIEPLQESGREGFQLHHTFTAAQSDGRTDPEEALQRLSQQLPKGMTLSSAVKKHFFTTDYQLQLTADFLQMLPDGDQSLADKLESMNFIAKKLLSRQLDFSFDLTLPIRPLSHNADRVTDDGKTLTWDISPLSENRLELAVRVPNLGRIAAVTAAVLLAVIAFVLFIVRRRKKRSKG